MSDRESILAATVTALGGLTATVERDSDVPETVPAAGLVIVRSAAPEIDEATLGTPRTWYMTMDVPLELYVTGADASQRALRIDVLATQAYTALITNASLLGMLQHIEPVLLDPETIMTTGSGPFTAAQLTVRVEYDSETSVG